MSINHILHQTVNPLIAPLPLQNLQCDKLYLNQLLLGSGMITTVLATPPVADSVYTIPDVGIVADFVMTEGNQTINGVKTFTSSPVFPGLSFASLSLTDTSNQLILGTGTTTTLSATAPFSSLIYTIPDVGAAAEFVMSEGIQTIDGAKTFLGLVTFSGGYSGSAASIALTNTTNQITLGTTNTTTINSVAPVSSRTYTIQDVGAAANFVMSEGIQTINGAKTFGSSITCPALTATNTTNQLVLGVTNTTTITSVAPSVSRVYTIPDAGGAASFVMTAGTQTVGGAKTFSTQVIINPTTNQLVLGVTNTTTINSVAPSASRVYTIPDAGTSASFVMSESTQTINGDKTLNGLITFGSNILMPTIGGTPSNFNYYEELDTTLDFTGNFAGTQQVACKYTRVGRMVTVSMEPFTVAANAVGGINSAAIPTQFRPIVANVSFISPVRNNSVTTAGGVTLTTGGVFAFNRLDLTGTPGNFFTTFENAGNVGIIDNAFTWQI